jgi:hypothetical protein
MLNYQKKYFKYKMKYLELKKQIGGIGECFFVYKSGDNANLLWDRLNNNKCNKDDIKNFGPEGFIKAGLLKLNDSTSNHPLITYFDIKDLKKAGYTAQQLNKISKEYYFAGKLLHFGGFTIVELRAAGFEDKDIAFELIDNLNYKESDLLPLFSKSTISDAIKKFKEIEEQRKRPKSRPEAFYM